MHDVTHSPVHGQVCANVIEVLSTWSPNHSKGLLLANQPAVLIRWLDRSHNLGIVCNPDIAFIESGRLPPHGLAGDHLPVAPDLAVEALRGPIAGKRSNA